MKISYLNINTLRFNFKYLPFKKAIKLPFLVSKNVSLLEMNGTIEINSHIVPGMIKIGYNEIGIFDKKYSRTVLQVKGKIIFNGKAEIGHGSKISVGKHGVLTIGNNFRIAAESTIACHKEITIGENCIFSWDIQLIDTDFHKIKDKSGIILNPNMPIIIGNSVWIGCRCLITRGAIIPNNSVITSDSCVTHMLKGENCIFGGKPIKMIKSDITWEA